MNTPRRRHQSSENARPLDREVYKLELIRKDAVGFAVLEVLGSTSLEQLAAVLVGQGGLDAPYSFTFSREGGVEERFGADGASPTTLLGGFALDVASTFKVAFQNAHFEAHVVAVTDAAEGASYPSVVDWKIGSSVPGLPSALGDLAAEIRLLVEQETRKEGSPQLDRHLELLERFIDTIKGNLEHLVRFMQALGSDFDVLDWAWDVAHEFAEAGRHHETLGLLDRMESVPDLFPEVRPLRAQVLLSQGRLDEARSLTEAMIADSASPEQEFLAGRALPLLVGLGELKRAEEMAYKLRKHEDLTVQCDAVEALIDIYHQTGRKQQARKLERELEKLERMAESQNDEPWWNDAEDPSEAISSGAIQAMAEQMGVDLARLGITPEQILDGSAAPQIEAMLQQLGALGSAPVSKVKVGRNDPCPCGSGKKFKKCCGQ